MEMKTRKLFAAFLCCIGFLLALSKPPQKFQLDPVPEMEVGKQYNLTCRVFGVAPIRNLTVTLLKGEEQLLVKTFENHTQPEAGAVVVNHSITAQEDDHRKTITCRTSLDLRPRGPLLKNTSHGISLWISGTGPLEQMTLELQKASLGQNWAYNLLCHIIRVNPCRSLVVTFSKGSERLGPPIIANCVLGEIANYTVTLPVTLHPEDHGQEAYCHASVHFGLQEPAYQTLSSGVSLKTAESHLAIIVAATVVAALLACVLVLLLIFIVKLWIN